MDTLLSKLLPIFLFFGLGILLKKVRFAETNHADFLLKLVFFVTLPALILLRLSQTPITWEKSYLPFISFATNLCCMSITLILPRITAIQTQRLGTMLVSTMIANSVFTFPFIIAGFGDTGFADAVLFDFGNGLCTATITYMMAFKYGQDIQRSSTMIIKLVRSPLFWAFVFAIGMSAFSISLPKYLNSFLDGIGQMTSPLILIALGVFFQPRSNDLKFVFMTLFVRVGIGMAVGCGLAYALGLTGQTFSVVAICSAAPVGFMALTFASIAGLDNAFASNVVSISILLGVIYIPILLILI